MWRMDTMALSNNRRSAPPYGTIAYAAHRLGLSRPTIYRLIDSGHLATYKIGRAHRTTDAAIDKCVERLMSEEASRREVA
jgi:excisionase family DNA binding protein